MEATTSAGTEVKCAYHMVREARCEILISSVTTPHETLLTRVQMLSQSQDQRPASAGQS
jgi:hypothetical protein